MIMTSSKVLMVPFTGIPLDQHYYTFTVTIDASLANSII